jgi:hypothetical protein
MTQLDGPVLLLKAEHDRLTKQMRGISAALAAFGAAYGKGQYGERCQLRAGHE